MTSLAQKIASLTNPTPKVHDPEDDVNTDTVAKVNKFSDDSDEITYTVSELRSKTAPLLEDIDPAYAGRKVSRKSLDSLFNDDENTFSKDENSDQLSDESESSNESEDEEEDDDLNDEDLAQFKNCVKKQELPSDDDEGEDEESGEGEGEESDEEKDEGSDESNDEVENCDNNKFSNIDASSEIEKGKAIKAQQELWDRLCECRIQLQKLLIIANKLPQSNCWKILKMKGGNEVSNYINKGSNAVKALLNSCLTLQGELLKQNPETNNLINSNNQETADINDEEIPSDTDEEMDVSHDGEAIQKTEKICLKRKLKCEEYGEILAKQHKSLIPYRDSVIQKWDEKTKLSSGKITQKSFSAFERSAVKQIEEILQDQNRLIKRTQLKRSLYRVLGKPDVYEVKSDEKLKENKPGSKQDMLLRDYDPEIFDDYDFFYQLVKDVINSKSVDNPDILRQQREIQSIRNKVRRKVDTKASKGRKIRYDVHPKLVNFMAPIETSTISDEARDNLLKCLFGRISATNS